MPTPASPLPNHASHAVPAFTPAVFIALSSGLTGVAAAQLKPAADPLDIANRFHAAILARVPAPALDHIAALFLAAPTPVEGASAVLDDPGVGAIGRGILKLWLLGAWHAPDTPDPAVEIISAQAYRESLVRRAMQAHSLGRGRIGLRHLAKPSPPLSRFTDSANP